MYKGCFEVLHREQLVVVSGVLAAKDVADIGLALLGRCLLGSLELVSEACACRSRKSSRLS